MGLGSPPPAVAEVRVAVRRALTGLTGMPSPGRVLVACSGGADSLALAAATAFVAPRLGWSAGAVVVDHGLQEGSADVAERAAAQCVWLGLEPVAVRRVEVVAGADGPEAAARSARYAALAAAAEELGASLVLLGHTLDDQAEQVLLGLARGSGGRSLAGMPPSRTLGAPGTNHLRRSVGEEGRPPAGEGQVGVVRPLLGVRRATTRQACADLGLEPWEDPHNADGRYARVRARAALADLEDLLGPGLVTGLARTADLLRDDGEVLDALAWTAYLQLGELPWEARRLADLPRAVRTRLWRRAALEAGSPGTDLTSQHLLAVDALVTDWRGQGPLHLPGGVRAGRDRGRVWVDAARRGEM